jgi:phosphomannomutase
MTNFALEKALAEEGLELIRAAVGDKYVLEAMESTRENKHGEPEA